MSRRLLPPSFLAIAGFGFFSPAAQAAESAPAASFGVLGGMIVRTSGGSGLAYEVKADFRLGSSLMLGAYYLGTNASLNVVDAGVTNSLSISTTAWGAEALYAMPAGVLAGAKLGLINLAYAADAKDSASSHVALDSSYNSIFVAPTVSYDHMINTGYSLGGEVAYVFPFNGSIPRMLAVLVSVKLHL